MEFTGLPFLGFLALVAALYWLCPARLRALFLLLCSYVFYCSWNAGLALLLFGATVAAYLVGRAVQNLRSHSAKRAAVLLFVSALVLLLTVYKAAPLLHQALGWNLLMPLGISYYFFKLIGYVIDVYWGEIQAETRFIPFAAYVAFFPQIVAGPIQRSQSLLPQLHTAPSPSPGLVAFGILRILLGYFKKFVVADNLGLLVNFIYSHLHSPGIPLLPAFYAFPLQMYADFSGLTDIANGAACLLGIEPAENFNAPFFASSPSEYWRRWHISLTRWLSDYVFTPLRMATRAFGNAGLVFSLLANMVLIGLWHGLRWNFVLFGVVHALYLSIDTLSGRWRKRIYRAHPMADTAMRWLGPLLTFHFVAIAFVFFRAETVGDVAFLLSRVGRPGVNGADFAAFWQVSGHAVCLGLAAYPVAEALDYLRRGQTATGSLGALPRWGRWAVYSCTAVAVLTFLSLVLVNGSVHSPFIYAIF